FPTFRCPPQLLRSPGTTAFLLHIGEGAAVPTVAFAFLFWAFGTMQHEMRKGDVLDPPAQAMSCALCNTPFSWRVRRHHCRVCGAACCEPCSKAAVLVQGLPQRQRACVLCIASHITAGGTQDMPIRKNGQNKSAPSSPRSSSGSQHAAPGTAQDSAASCSPPNCGAVNEKGDGKCDGGSSGANSMNTWRHEHKRPVQVAKEANPLALPWFEVPRTGPTLPSGPEGDLTAAIAAAATAEELCTCCEDIWRVAWDARADLLADLARCVR
ncbi:unnamed protein product, partial [Phaeothamnion confervicola]